MLPVQLQPKNTHTEDPAAEKERCWKDAADVGPGLTSTQLFKQPDQPETNHKFL